LTVDLAAGRVAKLELEWALRAGEASTDRAFRVAAIKKVKGWPKRAGAVGDDAAPSAVAWQYLAELEVESRPALPCAAPQQDDAAIWRECQAYFQSKAAKDAAMRTLRIAVVRERWPAAVQAFESCAVRGSKGSKTSDTKASPKAAAPATPAAVAAFPLAAGPSQPQRDGRVRRKLLFPGLSADLAAVSNDDDVHLASQPTQTSKAPVKAKQRALCAPSASTHRAITAFFSSHKRAPAAAPALPGVVDLTDSPAWDGSDPGVVDLASPSPEKRGMNDDAAHRAHGSPKKQLRQG